MKASTILSSMLVAFATQAAVFDFDLQGRAGFGLLSGNELHTVNGTPGSGGETGLGIFYNDVSNLLTINIGWGSGNGFTDLTGNATAGHIHGLTSGSAPTSFTQTATVRYGLDSLAGWNNSASNGGFIGTVTISEADEAALFAGRMYINVHTSSNGPGEIRGQLTAVPEPGETVAAVSVALGLFAVGRRFRSSVKA
jgi:hypothetical protein